MAVCVKADPHGQLYLNRTADCRDFVMITRSEYDSLMDYSQVTSSEAVAYFGGGFSLVFCGGFLLTYGIKTALKLIKLI